MSKIKNALLDLEIIRAELNYRRNELAQFKAANEYTRGGTYPKELGKLKESLAVSIIRLHYALMALGMLPKYHKHVQISRNRYAYMAANGRPGIATKTKASTALRTV